MAERYGDGAGAEMEKETQRTDDIHWRYREIEDDIVGELLDVACWFSPYDKESQLKRAQLQNLMSIVRAKLEALDALYYNEMAELHRRIENRETHINALEDALHELLAKYRSEIELSECLVNLDLRRDAIVSTVKDDGTESGPRLTKDRPQFSSVVKERIRMLNRPGQSKSSDRTICTNIDHRGNNRRYATLSPHVASETDSDDARANRAVRPLAGRPTDPGPEAKALGTSSSPRQGPNGALSDEAMGQAILHHETLSDPPFEIPTGMTRAYAAAVYDIGAVPTKDEDDDGNDDDDAEIEYSFGLNDFE